MTDSTSAGADKTARASKARKTPSLPKLITSCLEDAKAEDIVTIDMDGKAALADVMIVASGRSNRHVSAVTDQLSDALKEGGYKDVKVEGLPHCDWVVMDTGDVIVHIFRPEVRSFYNIEKLWSADAPVDASADASSA